MCASKHMVVSIVKVYEQRDELKTALTKENQNIDMKKSTYFLQNTGAE